MTKITLPTALTICLMTLPAYAQQNNVPTPDNCEAYKSDPLAYEVLLTQGQGVSRIPYIVDGVPKNFTRSPNLMTMVEAGGKNIFLIKSPGLEALNVELHDPFRNVDLILDVCNGKVLYKDSSSPDFRDLYTLGLPEVQIGEKYDIGLRPSYLSEKPAQEDIGAIGYSSSTKDIAGVLLKLSDGKWGEFPRGDDELWQRQDWVPTGNGDEHRELTTVGGVTASYYMAVTTSAGKTREPKFKFTETARTDTNILLHDEGRKVDLDVNLDTMVVTYSDNDGKSFPLWVVNSIVNSADLIK